MTPLAAKLAKQLTLPIRERSPFWADNIGLLREALHDAHFFEVSAALPMIKVLGEALQNIERRQAGVADVALADLLFLPAPKTWIEFHSPPLNRRIGFYLVECGTFATVEMYFDECANNIGKISLVSDDFKTGAGKYILPQELLDRHTTDEIIMHYLALMHFFLAIINTPRMVGRKQIMPHAGLQRRLTKEFGIGKFPLRAWTEIKLEICKPTYIDDGEVHEAYLTGRRALHFVRKFLRFQSGRLVYVTSHWRGDAALGIKQSRYTLV